jgi:hypothetical protein
MALQDIGPVTTQKTKKTYRVFFDTSDRSVYVGYAGKTKIGRRANDAGHAMNIAKAWATKK